ncbi:MlaD family protein [Fibrobacterota bacterium]
MNSIYRKTGFITWFSVLLAIIAVCFILALDVMKGPNLLKVSFPNVGTLILQEPVSMDGVQIGEVAAIEYTTVANPDYPEASDDSTIENALVTLELYKRQKLPEDSRIVNFNHSLMGARMIFIQRGESGKNMDVSKIQRGYFDEGVAEMLHKAEELLNLVRKYHNIVIMLDQGTDSTISLSEFYQGKLRPFFQKYTGYLEEMAKVEKQIMEKVEIANRSASKFASFAEKLADDFPEMVKKTEALLNQMETGMKIVEELMDGIHAQMAQLEKDDNIMNKLVYQRDIFEDLKKLNEKLNILVSFIRGDGISDIINFWENIHIMGPNPTRGNRE